MASEEFDRLAEHFREDTGMSAPGKDEPTTGAIDYTRLEVRELMWNLWLSARRRLEELRTTYAGTLGQAMNLEGEVTRLQTILAEVPRRIAQAQEIAQMNGLGGDATMDAMRDAAREAVKENQP